MYQHTHTHIKKKFGQILKKRPVILIKLEILLPRKLKKKWRYIYTQRNIKKIKEYAVIFIKFKV